jgi:hypothetical protein
MFKIFYGIIDIKIIDVTNIVIEKFYYKNENKIIIPSSDYVRGKYFTDPLFEVRKKIYIQIILNEINKINEIKESEILVKGNENKHNLVLIEKNYEFKENDEIIIDLVDLNCYVYDYDELNNKLFKIHENIVLKYGSIKDEMYEQVMTFRHLKGNEKVLEIGGNIGRNSVLIASILQAQNNDSNLLVLESDDNTGRQLYENRNLNKFKFQIEKAALSKNQLIQKGWDCIESSVLLPGYKFVNIINLQQIKDIYNINFDTLVLDCEGAFYYILRDFPEILDNIELIIIENDFKKIEHKIYVDQILEKNNFVLIYNKALKERTSLVHTQHIFFQVWKRFS